MMLELLILTFGVTDFDNLSLMDLYHLDTSQLKCIHSMWELCWIVEQLLSYSPCSECITFVAMHSCGAHAMVFPH